jgi:hypothetical protein
VKFDILFSRTIAAEMRYLRSNKKEKPRGGEK